MSRRLRVSARALRASFGAMLLGGTFGVLMGAPLGVAPAAARPRMPLRWQPDPSAVAAADIAMSRLARDKGQWAGMRALAAEDARLGEAPDRPAKDWLRGRAEPAAPMQWDPQTVYVSCNGLLAASLGRWHREGAAGTAGAQGRYATIWRRVPKKGNWQWIFTAEEEQAAAPSAQDFLDGHVAQCRTPEGSPPASGDQPPAAPQAETPPDESLLWSEESATDGRRQLVVQIWNGRSYDRVIGAAMEKR